MVEKTTRETGKALMREDLCQLAFEKAERMVAM